MALTIRLRSVWSAASTVSPTTRAPKCRSRSPRLARSSCAALSASSPTTTYHCRKPERTYHPAMASRYMAALASRWKAVAVHASLRSASAEEPRFRYGTPRAADHRASAAASSPSNPPATANAPSATSSSAAAVTASGPLASRVSTAKSMPSISALKENSSFAMVAPFATPRATASASGSPLARGGTTMPMRTSPWSMPWAKPPLVVAAQTIQASAARVERTRRRRSRRRSMRFCPSLAPEAMRGRTADGALRERDDISCASHVPDRDATSRDERPAGRRALRPRCFTSAHPRSPR